ncbi:hypothetical protein N7490_004403 [Penicillium lividum]|nr:hypothetical protein N7490_004403 [Penicillium lividum]
MDSKSPSLIGLSAGSEILSETNNRSDPKFEDGLSAKNVLEAMLLVGLAVILWRPTCRQIIDADTCNEIRSYTVEFSALLTAVLQGIRVYRGL